MTDHEHINMRDLEGALIADRYRLQRFLDEGNFGAVFRATHLAYGVELREVAIKLAKRPMTDREARRAFGDALNMTRVADTAPDASLKEHFVMVHDAGRCPESSPLAGHPYVVMELVRGGSLTSSLRAGPFPLTRAIAYFDQILKAMAFMHSPITEGGVRREALAHRDLKPSNILVTRRVDSTDLLKITDFGLAIEVDSLLGWVESGGDLAYLAPESFSHNICSPQSDVYMLGLVFYEMLAAKNPFSEVGSHLRGDDQAKREELRKLHLTARHAERFPLLETHEELKLTPEIGRVIKTALQADMTGRAYRNAAEMADAWRQARHRAGSHQDTNQRPWQTVRRLTAQAEQCFAVGDWERGDALLAEAMEINCDSSKITDQMAVGLCYLLAVERSLTKGDVEQAAKLAVDGYRRRKCRSTCRAMAKYYASQNSPLSLRFQQESETCRDQE